MRMRHLVAKMICPMKQFFSYLGASLAAIAALASCNKEIETPVEDIKGGVPFEICASADDTKTAIDEDFKTTWVVDGTADQINVYHKEASATEYTYDNAFTAQTVDGKFSGTLTSALMAEKKYQWLAKYPYDKSLTTPTEKYSYIGSRADGTQSQTGLNSTAHLSGYYMPLVGKGASVGTATPTIAMKHASSVIEINVSNSTNKALDVTSITFTAPESIIGQFVIDYTGETTTYAEQKYASAVATLSVTNGTIASGASGKFYIAIKPFTAPTGQTLNVSVNGYEKEIPLTKDVSFTAGNIKKINFNYDYDPSKNVNATFDFTNSTEFSSAKIDAPSSSDGVNIDGVTITKSDIGLSFLKGTSNYIRWWNASGTLELRTYVGNQLSFTAPDGFNIVKIKLSSSYDYDYTANTGTFSSDTWTGEASEVTLTRSSSGTHKVSSITVHCEKAAVVPGIVSTSTDEDVQGGVGLTTNITLTNYDSAPSLTATPDGAVVTAASVGSITTTGATVTYTLAPNYATSTKAGTITIDDGAGHSGTITVNQPAAVFSVSSTSLTLGAASESSATITVTSDYDWTVVDDFISGFTVSPASFTYNGTQDQTVTITATAANKEASPVVLGRFTFKRAGDNAKTDVITISQASAKLAPPTITLTPDAANKKFTVSWKAVDNASKYEYCVLDGSAEYKVAVTQTEDASTTSFEVTDINLDEEYTVSVKALGDNNPWVDSDEADDTITVTAGGAADDVIETIDFEAENFSTSYTGWTFTNLSRANAITAKAGSYYATNSSSTTASVQTKTTIASPKSLKCYYSKSTSNTNNSSKFIIQVSEDGKSWTNVSTGSTMNNVTKGTWYELKADLTSYSNVYVRVYYSGTNTTRCLDEIEFIYKNKQQQ